MEEKDAGEGGGSPRSRTIAVALKGGSTCKYIVRWAIEKFGSEGKVEFKLLHVFPKINGVPTPMGNLIPLAQVRDDIAAAYKKEVEWQKTERILPYQKLFSHKKIPAEVVLIESDDIPCAISMAIARYAIKDLVIGASSNSLFARRIKGHLPSSVISGSIPGFCMVYVVSKGKLESLRPSEVDPNECIIECGSSAGFSTDSSSRFTSSTFDLGSSATASPAASPRQTVKRLESFSNGKYADNNPTTDSAEFNSPRSVPTREADDDVSFNASLVSRNSSAKSLTADSRSRIQDQVRPQKSRSVPELQSTPRTQQSNISLELDKLKIELRHIRGMYAIAQNEATDATLRLSDLSKLRYEEALKLKEINEKEVTAREVANSEMEKFEAAKREAWYARECTKREAYHRKEAELKAAYDAKQSEKLKSVLAGPQYQYQKFTWEEIVSATHSFNKELQIGEGSYGTVYKGRLHHTTVAVKILHSKEGTNDKQFHQELEILSKIRHPHLLLLLGACPERGCLVYEYMENGSLEDRLFRKDKTPPIPWYERLRIAWEVATALVFLHNNKPKPIIHRDLKPANILLDHHLVSKIGDAGLCTMLNLLDPTSTMFTKTMYKETSPVGTLCYIDPEYQRSGLVSIKSDVYALGMVILQLLTAKPAVGITNVVEDAIIENRLADILDKDAGRWPMREAAELALLGVQCAELRRKDRPDLKEQVLPALERLKDMGETARDVAAGIQIEPPRHFICPMLKDVMEDPCVASDGYTYDRKAIELWLKDNDTSPTTDFPLSNKHLIPNYTLQYAILEWKSKRRPRQNASSRKN